MLLLLVQGQPLQQATARPRCHTGRRRLRLLHLLLHLLLLLLLLLYLLLLLLLLLHLLLLAGLPPLPPGEGPVTAAAALAGGARCRQWLQLRRCGLQLWLCRGGAPGGIHRQLGIHDSQHLLGLCPVVQHRVVGLRPAQPTAGDAGKLASMRHSSQQRLSPRITATHLMR